MSFYTRFLEKTGENSNRLYLRSLSSAQCVVRASQNQVTWKETWEDPPRRETIPVPKHARIFSTTVLKIHHRTHRGEKSFRCNKCDKSFSKSNHWKVRNRSPTSAQIVSWASTIYTQGLNIQERTRKKDQKPFKCTICGKSFSESDYLDRHMRKSLQEPFRCTKMWQSFSF